MVQVRPLPSKATLKSGESPPRDAIQETHSRQFEKLSGRFGVAQVGRAAVVRRKVASSSLVAGRSVQFENKIADAAGRTR